MNQLKTETQTQTRENVRLEQGQDLAQVYSLLEAFAGGHSTPSDTSDANYKADVFEPRTTGSTRTWQQHEYGAAAWARTPNGSTLSVSARQFASERVAGTFERTGSEMEVEVKDATGAVSNHFTMKLTGAVPSIDGKLDTGALGDAFNDLNVTQPAKVEAVA